MSRELIASIGRAIVLKLFDAGVPARSSDDPDDEDQDHSRK